MQNLVPMPPPVPAFTPVPRKLHRIDGWTAERQRGFIAALAETGSVRSASRRINMAATGAYQLRMAQGADSFRQAWDAAQAHGVQNLIDLAMERVTEGVAVPVFYKGEACGEKRWFDNRLLMFLLKHHLPALYGAPLRGGTRSQETLEREARENCPVCRAQREQDARQIANAKDPDAAPDPEEQKWLDEILKRYKAMVSAERNYRLTGQIVAADYTLRQLTHLELILDCGGMGMLLIDAYTREGNPEIGEGTEHYASDMSRALDQIRRDIWAKAKEPDRPALNLPRTCPRSSTSGGPTIDERQKARRAAEARIAQAQQEWEAAQREDSWALWKERRDGCEG